MADMTSATLSREPAMFRSLGALCPVPSAPLEPLLDDEPGELRRWPSIYATYHQSPVRNLGTQTEDACITPPTRDQGVGATPIEIEMELEGHRLYRETKTFAPKNRVYVAGVKRKQVINRVPTDQEKDPLFIQETIEANISCCPHPFSCTCMGVDLESDADLVYHLKSEAMFTPRTPLLLQQLKLKARRWMAGWDMSKYTSKQAFQILLHAVTMAYTISPEEKAVMKALRNTEVLKLIEKFNSYFGQRG